MSDLESMQDDFAWDDYLTYKNEQELQQELHKDDLLIEDFFITYPFKTLLPEYTYHEYNIPNIKHVLKNRRIGDLSENEEYYYIDINNALVMGIKLIGLDFKSYKYSSNYRQQIKDYFSLNITKKYKHPYYNKILGFQLSNYLTIKIKTLSEIPFIKLLNFYPHLIYFDSVVQISIALLSFIVANKEDKPDVDRAKGILTKSGLKAFMPGKRESNSRAVLYFRKAPQVLHLLVIIYKSILNNYLSHYHSSHHDKKDNIYKAFEAVFNKSPDKKIIDNFKKYEDRESYAVAFIAYKYEAPFQQLRKLYQSKLKKVALGELEKDNKLYKSTLSLIKKEKPDLSPWIEQLYK